MKLLTSKKINDRRQQSPSSGQVLAEACIGLSMLVLLWLLLSFSSYMANSRIRTAMAARDAVWLQANGENTDTVPGAFYYGKDVNLAAVAPAQEISLSSPISFLWSGKAWSNSVSFGMSPGALPGTTHYPFVLLNARIPILPADIMDHVMDHFLSVNTGCAWPADVGNTYTGFFDAWPFHIPIIPRFP